ncbi:ABC transporter ATP-binding protein [Methylophaga sp. OBS3]|uniref:ABC transporter ATP-binding protein n=1 Tax=Methylophaga sp. OBS3 TaxID=2991934 RepID=UPI0022538A63|nr:ATP-binding cassette domain-containing protein [Methylophaga sp. OBS3]MCX4188766.1 ABC transporter ATP-binding protein [Methylophaga sp. OBS3]
MQSLLLSAVSLQRAFSHHTVVNNLSFDVYRGEVLGFLGPNGAGKSTTMKMLTGNLAPDSGSILINGIDLLSAPQAAKRYIGYLPENPPLYRELTVNEYLGFCGRLHGLSGKSLQTAIDEVLNRCGLTHMRHRLIGQLSKGYQQRAGIAQAIIHQPEVVILDEPTSGLDPIQIQQIRQLIRDIANQHSVILSTHILPEVEMLCDRVQIMHQGQLVFSDSLQGLKSQRQHRVLKVAFRQAPSQSELLAIDGVTDIEVIDNQQFRLFFAIDTDPTDQLVSLAVSNNWQLTQLTPEQDTLEQLFTQLIRSETEGVSL